MVSSRGCSSSSCRNVAPSLRRRCPPRARSFDRPGSDSCRCRASIPQSRGSIEMLVMSGSSPACRRFSVCWASCSRWSGSTCGGVYGDEADARHSVSAWRLARSRATSGGSSCATSYGFVAAGIAFVFLPLAWASTRLVQGQLYALLRSHPDGRSRVLSACCCSWGTIARPHPRRWCCAGVELLTEPFAPFRAKIPVHGTLDRRCPRECGRGIILANDSK